MIRKIIENNKMINENTNINRLVLARHIDGELFQKMYKGEELKSKLKEYNIKIGNNVKIEAVYGQKDRRTPVYGFLEKGELVYQVTIFDDVTIGNNVEIKRNVSISHGSIIGDNVTIGRSSYIFNNVTIGDNVEIGKNVTIGPNTVVENNIKIKDKIHIEGNSTIEKDII